MIETISKLELHHVERKRKDLVRFGLNSKESEMANLAIRTSGKEMPAWVGGLSLADISIALNGTALPPNLREIAEHRLSTLRKSLQYRDPNEIAGIILRMMAGFPSARQSNDDARSTIAAYVEMLGNYPPWAVEEARRRWISTARSEGHSLAFPPSAAELSDGCDRLMRKFRHETTELINALDAKGLPPIPKAKLEPCRYDYSMGPVRGFFDKSSRP